MAKKDPISIFKAFAKFDTMDRRARANLVQRARRAVAHIDPQVAHQSDEERLLVLYADVIQLRHNVKIWRNK